MGSEHGRNPRDFEGLCGFKTGGVECLNPRRGYLKGASLKRRDAREWESGRWGSDHSADENLTPPPYPSPWRWGQPRAEGKGLELDKRSLPVRLNRSALVFTQLEPYMDENFISRAFATMGETVMSVKIIRNRLTGYVRFSPSIFSVFP